MKRPDPERLLAKLTVGEAADGESADNLREVSLARLLVAARRRRRQRALISGAAATLVVAMAFLVIADRTENGGGRMELAAEKTASVAATGTTMSGPTSPAQGAGLISAVATAPNYRVKILTDEELLAMFSERGAALVGAPGAQRLILLDASQHQPTGL